MTLILCTLTTAALAVGAFAAWRIRTAGPGPALLRGALAAAGTAFALAVSLVLATGLAYLALALCILAAVRSARRGDLWFAHLWIGLAMWCAALTSWTRR